MHTVPIGILVSPALMIGLEPGATAEVFEKSGLECRLKQTQMKAGCFRLDVTYNVTHDADCMTPEDQAHPRTPTDCPPPLRLK